jgi:hypothetical protein
VNGKLRARRLLIHQGSCPERVPQQAEGSVGRMSHQQEPRPPLHLVYAEAASAPQSMTELPSGFNFLVGAWTLVAPFTLRYSDQLTPTINDVVVGLCVAAVAVLRMLFPGRTVQLSVLNVGLGAWLASSPAILSYGPVPTAAVVNDVIAGIVIVLLGCLSVVTGRADRRAGRGRP